MITYNRTAFGLNLLFRVHGSAVYRAVVPSLISVGIYFLIRNRVGPTINFGDELGHPYAVGVLVASITFLIVFRANQGYARYWEGASAVHHMMSKWMDATTHSGVFHLQCDHYKDIKPPSYFDYPELNDLYLSRDRERGSDAINPLRSDSDLSLRRRYQERRTQRKEEISKKKARAVVKSINYIEDSRKRLHVQNHRKHVIRSQSADDVDALQSIETSSYFDMFATSQDSSQSEVNFSGDPLPMLGRPRLDGSWGGLYMESKVATFYDPQNPDKMDPKGFASIQGGRTPPLYLQELAHLSSLLVAVALSTLRNDIDGSESPLALYEPGSDWPAVDPDLDQWSQLKGWSHFFWRVMAFLGMGRSPKEQTRYNARRPLPVLGGVSDSEIRFLQMAKGPYAKTQLCWNWLSEFCIREHLAGSMGAVGPPIVSRIIQFFGDGMIHYNHARKVMFIPFPFVHAQLSVVFILILLPAIPFLMDQYTDSVVVGSLLTFVTVLCLSGIHEVARELENPFRNVPNELPLVTFQAQYNEALITMYSGYHPDQFWDGKRVIEKRRAGLSRAPPPPPGLGHRTSSAPETVPESSSFPALSPKEEISFLKEQLAEQSKLIDRLAQQLNSSGDVPAPPPSTKQQKAAQLAMSRAEANLSSFGFHESNLTDDTTPTIYEESTL